MPQLKDYYKPNLTQSAADMLVSLKNLLNLLNESLALKVFKIILKRVIIEIDKYFYEDIITQNQFNDGGSGQMAYDVNKYLLSILSQYGNEVKIETYFRRTKEALTLLQLNRGSALLHKEVLHKSLHIVDPIKQDKPNSNEINLANYDAGNALKELGVSQLSCEDAELVLSLRVDL